MRVISGSRRGKKLKGFEGDEIRPTTDRVKESIFNIISQYVPSAAVLDLFGGTGALSCEALSRGAENAVIVDASDESLAVIRENIKMLEFGDVCDIVKSDAVSYLERTDKRFDIIFLDPPYNKGFIEPVLDAISKRGILAEDGVIMLESDSTDMHESVDGLVIDRQRKYGRTYITIYKNAAAVK
jgi:16S rRNA (guanine(966)-N(2))-methyltransferase RsmD